ncbi:MAG: sugar MFS transporter [Halobacteriales archaeon]
MTVSFLRDRWTIGIFAAVALLGAQLQLRGTLLRQFERTFAVTPSELGLLSTVASLTFFITVAATSAIVGRSDARRLLLTGVLSGIGSFLVVAVAPSYLVLVLGMGALGVTSGILQGSCRPVMSHIHADRREQAFNFQDMIWAVGAALGPIIAVTAIVTTTWRLAYVALAAVAIIPLALFWRLELPAAVESEQSVTWSAIEAYRTAAPFTTLIGAFLALSFVESGLFTWLPYLFAEVLPGPIADLSLTVLLAAYIPGRYAFGIAGGRIRPLNLLAGSALLTVPLLFVALLGSSNLLRLIATFAIGFLVSGMFPTLLAWSIGYAPAYSAPVNAMAMGTASLGFLIFPAAIGVVIDHAGTTTAMNVIVAIAGILALLLLDARFRRGISDNFEQTARESSTPTERQPSDN